MLTTLANSIRTKMRAGGTISITDKRIASRAKAELRRRRDNIFHKMREETEFVPAVSYEDVFKHLCIESGITFNALSEEEKKEFLLRVDEVYKSN